MRRHVRCAALVSMTIAASLVGMDSSFAQATWTAATTGTWSDATKWSTGIVPGAGNSTAAVLSSTSASYTVTYDTAMTGTLGSFTLTNIASNTTTLNVNAARFWFTTGTMTNATININSGGSMAGTLASAAGVNVMNINGGSFSTSANFGSSTNQAASIAVNISSGSFAMSGNQNNFGAFNMTGGSVLVSGGVFDQVYTSTISGGTYANSSSNVFGVRGGTFTVSSAGRFDVNRFSVSAVAGNFRVEGGTMNVTGDTFTVGNNNTAGGARSGSFVQTGGSVAMANAAGLVLGQASGTGQSSSSLNLYQFTGGTLALEKVTLSTVSYVSPGINRFEMTGGTLNLRSGGFVIGSGSGTKEILLSGGTVAAAAAWSSSADMSLRTNTGSGTATFQAADSGGVARNITLSGVLSGSGALAKTGAGVLTLTGSNSFLGRTTIAEGVLAVTTIGNSGTANPLGTNATIGLGASTTTGTLRYTGSGETSNRGFSLSGTTGSGGVIEANGGGPLVFTGAVTAANGDKRLTLAGSNTADNLMAAIGNPATSGSTSLVKAGAGRWVLAGSSSYTGSTTIDQGELVLAANAMVSVNGALGANGNAAVTVGSLAGSGTAALLLRQGVTVDTRTFTIPGGAQATVIGAIDGSGTATFGSAGDTKISLGRDVVLQAASGGSLVLRNQWLQASGTSVNVNVGSVGNDGSVQLGQPLAATGAVRINRGILSLVTKDPQDPGDPIFGSLAAASAVVVGPVGSVNAVLNVGPSGTSGAYVFGAAQTLSGIGTIQLDTNTPVSVAGFFSPGNSPGIFTFQGDGSGGTTTLSGTTFMEITGTTAGTTYDQVKFTSGALLNYGSGSLLLDLTGTYSDNTQFQLFDFASTASGSFTTISGSGSYGLLSFVRGTSGVWTSGPTTQPNQTFEFREATGTLVVVPEPATLALAAIGIGLAGWAAVRRRKK